MNKNKRLKIKILLTVITLIILSTITYISLPCISYALDNTAKNNGIVNIPENSAETQTQIHEHRGYGVIAKNDGDTEEKTYSEAAGNTGIKNINSYLGDYMNDPSDWDLGWVYSLRYNTSIYCNALGVLFPNLNNKYLNLFHTNGGKYDTTNSKLYEEVVDYIEYWKELSCVKEIPVLYEDYLEDIVVDAKEKNITEEKLMTAEKIKANNGKYVIKREMIPYLQYTIVNVNYSAEERDLEAEEAYIFTYSSRTTYKYDPAQVALWVKGQGKHGGKGAAVEKGEKLYKAAMAFKELNENELIKPKISASNNNKIGTVLDGSNYKVGPFKINDYTYAYSENVKEFSGQASLESQANADIINQMTESQKELFKGIICGIIEAKVELDNGEKIYLDKSNILYSEQDSNTKENVFYESPSLHGYDFPTPNSNFYIKLPIDDCGDATKIEKITMKYKWHTADGRGGDLEGTYDEVKWENQKYIDPEYNNVTLLERQRYNHTTYRCNNEYGGYTCKNDELDYTERSCYTNILEIGSKHNIHVKPHRFICGITGWCKFGSNVSVTNQKQEGGNIRLTNAITNNCESEWACGIEEHQHWENCSYSSEKCDHWNCSPEKCNRVSYGNNSVGCTHTHTENCCEKDVHQHKIEDCGIIHTCNKNYCIHGFIDGLHECYAEYGLGDDEDYEAFKHKVGDEDIYNVITCLGKAWGDSHIGNCYGEIGIGTVCNKHGTHRNCYKYIWKCTQKISKDSQKLMYVKDAQVYEHNVECSVENIPLRVDVEIDKYISAVNGEELVNDVPDNTSLTIYSRSGLKESVKENNPVYVEPGDYVTYKIVMKNSSEISVKIKVDDILPDESAYDVYDFVSANFGEEKIENITDFLKLREKIITIEGNSEASFTITIQVNALKGKYENKAMLITRNGTNKNNTDDVDYIKTEDDAPVINHDSTICTCESCKANPTKWESSDWFIVNNYNASIDKYIYKYDEAKQRENNNTLFITNEYSIVGENNILKETRANINPEEEIFYDGVFENKIKVSNAEHEKYKENHPVNVEKYEKVTYAIRVSNDATTIENTNIDVNEDIKANKPATNFKINTIRDELHKGLEYESITATIFDKSGNKIKDVLEMSNCCKYVNSEGDYDIYEITTPKTIVINPGEYIEIYMEVKIVQSNMFLYDMRNTAKLVRITNSNDFDVTGGNISKCTESSEFVRMKDLVISGRVWLDFNQDGLINDSTTNDLEKIDNKINSDAMKKDVLVRLYQIDSNENPILIRTTRTDENGLYTFARNESLTWYETFNHTSTYSNDKKYQRIDKASNKDETTGEYTSNSKYNKYYVEFVYDGVVYKSTDIYAGMDNLNGNGSLKKEGNLEPKYIKDSNATELKKDREDFNRKYEYISYNIAYDFDNKDIGRDLVFKKDGHSSILMEDSGREMTSKSFVIKPNNQEITYLWLYPFNGGSDPETNYLKYINLGLELREDVDLELSKDVYKVKTTINGEEMEYDYNLGETLEYANPYIVKKPYGFEVYEADYKYRVEQYIAEAVEVYKGLQESNPDQKFGTDELAIEVTYRINLKNINTPDGDGDTINTPLDVRIHEILDLYDQNFVDVAESPITIKTKDENTGILIDKQIQAGEAWVFMKKEDASEKELLDGGKTYSIRESEVENGKPIYVLDADGEYVKVKLKVSGTTNNYSIKKDNNFAADGYKTSYISGMDDFIIPEGGDLDIFVKYVLDKDQLEVTVDESYEESQTSEVRKFNDETKTSSIEVVTNDNIATVITNIRSETRVVEGVDKTVKVADLRRSIKLAEKINTIFKNKNGRGTENIAQINAYSVWYTDGKPASLVDKDSNAGNIGIKNTSEGKSPNASGYSETTTSADDIAYYEDMTYKTGIEIAAEGTENTRDVVEKIYYERISEDIEIIDEITQPLTRKISGIVWDDSRSTTMGNEPIDKETAQYIGNGMYNPQDGSGSGDKKIEEAQSNVNVEMNYKGSDVTEDTDIAVRNVKVGLVEIVNVNGKYYEEVLTNITWDQKQSERTKEDGKYELYGFVPGTYVVRFTYGDYIDIPGNLLDLSEKQKDMLIFNGQDYKSTQYTGANESLDSYKDADKIIVEFNDEHESDARDDEIRRLEVNSFSEVMTNETAEILKGLVNGTKETPNSTANSAEELKALVENTYMIADTREFLVKPEKLLDDTQKTAYEGEYMYSDSLPFYKYFTSMKNKHIKERDFNIKNIDFGIEYRPESEISLMKEIEQITLTTEDKETLVDLHFETNIVGNKVTHKIDTEKSIGYDLVQFITNEYKPKALVNNIVSEENVQGLAYIQIDEEILQGCTVKITYGFNAQNCSEVDRISGNLNAIRYRYNEATQKLIEEYKNNYSTKEHALTNINNAYEGGYSATALAKAVVFADTCNVDDDGIVYREIPKTLTTNGKDGYYGRYVGHGYYTGKIETYMNESNVDVPFDTISSLKFDKILDYIDTNLEYEQKVSSEEKIDRLWTKITPRELISLVNQYKELRQTVGSIDDDDLPKITNIDDVEYKSMVVSVSDRNVDPGDPNEKAEVATSIKNKDLSRFLIPKVVAVGIEGNDNLGKENDKNGKLGYDDYTGHIYLDVSKVLAAGSDNDDKTYENMAEIVQFTTLNGRRTNFATTIGNANIHDIKNKLENNLPPFDKTVGSNSGSIEFITSSIEPDTSATETITLIPPTGLMKNRRAIVSLMETAKVGVEVMSITGLVVVIVAGVVFLVILVIRKYKKRRIK